MKVCFKCSRSLPLEAFYRHSRMRDGRLNKCIECAKSDVRKDYRLKRETKSEYERIRNRRPERRAQYADRLRRYRSRYPDKARAHHAINNAIRDGRLARQPCRICGAKAQAHHDDYSKPLDVDWLCFKHHREIAHGQCVTVVTFDL